jgi:hypothetical protein
VNHRRDDQKRCERCMHATGFVPPVWCALPRTGSDERTRAQDGHAPVCSGNLIGVSSPCACAMSGLIRNNTFRPRRTRPSEGKGDLTAVRMRVSHVGPRRVLIKARMPKRPPMTTRRKRPPAFD